MLMVDTTIAQTSPTAPVIDLSPKQAGKRAENTLLAVGIGVGSLLLGLLGRSAADKALAAKNVNPDIIDGAVIAGGVGLGAASSNTYIRAGAIGLGSAGLLHAILRRKPQWINPMAQVDATSGNKVPVVITGW